ncbi:MAG: Helicase, C-terminal:DEAD/DEAH box helicase [Labilithrix sp.]|nr:Helicase, C-terminal:DEAD/DEAH box helicase [Labilithrix sp.]
MDRARPSGGASCYRRRSLNVTTNDGTLRALPPEDAPSSVILDNFLAYVQARGLDLYPAQEEAILELLDGSNVILNTPTGSGKSLVAEAAHYDALVRGERSYYTSPIKALANEKFFALVRTFGADNVGLMTGDATVNRDAPIICATAEVLSNIALAEGPRADVDLAVLDEFHYYADRERGVAWQIPLLALPNTRFLLMSATFGDPEPFQKRLTDLNGRRTAVVRSKDRPVPLEFTYSELPLHEAVQKLVNAGRFPIYLVNFTQRACAEEAQNLMSVDHCTKEEKKRINEALLGARFDSPYGRELSRFLRHGIGIHHAGLLPKYRLIVEKLAQKGLLKIISGTDTLGVGVNVPIRTVLFTKLCKYDGEKTAILKVRDFQQISGRAGRKGFDDQGYVVAQAPEHVIENLRLEQKAGADPAKKRKIVKKKPPDWGYVHWDKATFDKLVTAQPEPLVSRFNVSHGMVVSVLSREENGGCMALGRLIKRSHERVPQQRALGRTALEMFRSLEEAGILTRDFDEYDGRRRIVVNTDLGADFSIHHALSLYLLDTAKLLVTSDPAYELDLLTLVESILENPDIILARQLDKLKGDKVAELKAAGVEYEERMAQLEKLEYPKPQAEFIYGTFNAFAVKHPWVKADNIRPKSIAREMYENFISFSEYVREYGLERVEGVLLRYLSDVYKALVQNVPKWARTDAVDDVATYFGAIVRQVDASLLDEWERLKNPAERIEARPDTDDLEPAGSKDITKDPRAFTVLLRNEIFRLLRAISRRDWTEAARVVLPVAEVGNAGSEVREAARVEAELAPYFADHASLRIDPEARSPKFLEITPSEDATFWQVRQTLLDPEEDHDGFLELTVDLAASREAGKPVLTLVRFGR